MAPSKPKKLPTESRRVVLTLDGMPTEEGHVRASDFVKQLQVLLSALGKAEASEFERAEDRIYYRVVDLSHNSPARVVLEAVEPLEGPARAHAVFGIVSGALQAVAESRISEATDYELVSDIAALAAPVGKSIARLSLILGTAEHSITRDVHARASQLLARVETRTGTVTGMLDAINIHGSTRLFRIYPVVGAAKISCAFPDSLKPTALAGIGRYVSVGGAMSYRPLAAFPHSLEVQHLELLPEADSLPRLRALRGIAPNLTDGVSSETFIGRLRDADD